MQPLLRLRGQEYKDYVDQMINERWPGTWYNWDIRQGAGIGKKPLKAWVNYSNWAVNCDVCNESVVIEPDHGFICPNCVNANNGYYARRVLWPGNRGEIERILLLRSNPNLRTWHSDETTEDLKKQNEANGIGV